MRRIINSTYITLDGVVEGPHLWPSLGREGDPRGDEVWPTRSGDPVSDHFNAMPKYVVSTTLQDPEWNNTHVIAHDVVAEIERLKAAEGRDIVQYGFGAVTRLLLEHGLLDELRLWVHPLILGRGEPSDLLFGPAPATGFRLVDVTTLSHGIVILGYETERRLD